MMTTTFKSATQIEGFIVNSPSLANRLQQVGESTQISGFQYTLKSYLWRDFMPVCPTNGRPLTVINELSRMDEQPVPDYLDLQQLYVIHSEKVWIVDYSEEDRGYKSEYKIEKIARFGPKWGPNAFVDVVARVFNQRTGKVHLIRNGQQHIDKVE